MDDDSRMVLNTARKEFGGDVCACCGFWHHRNRKRGIIWSVKGESACGTMCAGHLMLGKPRKGDAWEHDR